jgi:hypothetical protein
MQQCFTRFGMITYLILANIGLFLNRTIVFSQWTYRWNSYSLYILTLSINGLFRLNISTIPIIYALNSSNPLNYNLFSFYEMQLYLLHAFNQLMRILFVIACADCYASCSNRSNIRASSRYEVAFDLFCCSGLS